MLVVSFCRFKSSPSASSSISKGAPDFCTVFIISKGKISSVRNATRPAAHTSPLLSHIGNLKNKDENHPEIPFRNTNTRGLFLSNTQFVRHLSILACTAVLIMCIYVQTGRQSNLRAGKMNLLSKSLVNPFKVQAHHNITWFPWFGSVEAGLHFQEEEARVECRPWTSQTQIQKYHL